VCHQNTGSYTSYEDMQPDNECDNFMVLRNNVPIVTDQMIHVCLRSINSVIIQHLNIPCLNLTLNPTGHQSFRLVCTNSLS
jgi:hypothetical protein